MERPDGAKLFALYGEVGGWNYKREYNCPSAVNVPSSLTSADEPMIGLLGDWLVKNE